VRCADGDEHAGFADFEAAKAVNDGEAMDSELFVDGLGDFAHFRKGHRLVGFVFEIESAATVGFVPDKAVEGDNRAIVLCADIAGNRGGIDRAVKQSEPIVVNGGVQHGLRLASAHRGKKGDGITVGDGTVPGGKFLIARGHQRRAKGDQVREARGVLIKDIRERCTGADFQRLLGDAGQLPEAAEEEHFEAKIG
jgi:hypothetical protein